MAILIATNHIASGIWSSTGVVEVTTAGYFDPLYVGSAVRVVNPDNYWRFNLDQAQEEMWVHFELRGAYASVASIGFYLRNALGANVFEMRTVSATGSPVSFRYNNGGTMTAFGEMGLAPTDRYKFDVHYKAGTGGFLRIYVNSALVAEKVGLSSAATDCNLVGFGSFTSVAAGSCFSQVIISTTSTLGMILTSRRADGNGAVTAPTGSYTDVSALPFTGTTSRELAAVNDAFTMTKPAFTLPDGYIIDGVHINNSVQATGAIVTNANHILRMGSTNYEQAIAPSPGGVFNRRSSQWGASPVTGQKFTDTEFNDAQFGLIAKA